MCQQKIDNMLENLLTTCGFNATEQRILLHLIEHKESIASLIAKKVGLKRTTVYAALDSLVQHGVVGKKKRGAVSYFSITSPTVFTKVVEEHARQQFEETKAATKLLEKELASKPSQLDLGAFQISSFESVEAVYVQLEDALLGGDFCSLFNPQVAVFGPFEDLIHTFLRQTAKTKPHIREILVAGPQADWYISHVDNPNHKIRLMPKDKKIVSDIILNKGSVILNHYDPKQESSIKITEKNLYTTMMTIFDELWKDPTLKKVR